MSDVEIRGKISVDTGNTQKSVNEMLESIKQTKKALADTKVGSEEYKAAQASLKKQTEELNKTMDQSSGSFSKLKVTLGQVVPGLDAASQGAAGFGKQLWLLVANPIVAIIAGIVVALTLLYKAFTSTNEGADRLEQVMAGIGAAVDVLRDRVLGVAKAIGEFFSGDFKKALETGRAAVSGIGQEIADEFAAAAQATRTIQDLADSMREISVGRAKLNRDLAQAKEIMNNADASFAERRAALNKVRAAESEQSKKELDQARAEYEERVRLNALSDTSDADLDREAQLKAKLYNLEESSATQLRSLNRMERTLAREEQSKAESERKTRDDREKKAWDDRLAKIKEVSEAERNEAAMTAQSVADIAAIDIANKKAADEQKDAIAQKEIDRASFAAQIRVSNYEAEKQLDEAALLNKRATSSAIMNIMATTVELLGRNTAASKALAVSGSLIDTYSAVVATLKAAAKTPAGAIPGYAIAQSISVGIAGLASVKRILSVQVPGGGGIGNNQGGGRFEINAPAPLAPQQTTTALDAGSIQGVGNAAAGGVGRSFVLDADIKSNQERQARIARAARLG
jgi:hypothetical protein